MTAATAWCARGRVWRRRGTRVSADCVCVLRIKKEKQKTKRKNPLGHAKSCTSIISYCTDARNAASDGGGPRDETDVSKSVRWMRHGHVTRDRTARRYNTTCCRSVVVPATCRRCFFVGVLHYYVNVFPGKRRVTDVPSTMTVSGAPVHLSSYALQVFVVLLRLCRGRR